MLQENPPLSDRSPGQVPHILIIGLGKMGQQLVIGSARCWKLSNPDIDKKMEISVIDIAAEQKLQSLQNQNPRLHNLVEFQAINMDLLSGDFDKAAEIFLTGDETNLDIVYICLDDETFCLQTGLRLNHQFRSQSLPIVMRMVESGGLALLLGDDLDKQNQNSFGNLKIFDLLDQTCTAELIQLGTHEILARNLHAVYLESSQGSDEALVEDEAQVPWDELPDYLKENNRQLADRIPAMLSATGYKITPLKDWDAENLTFQENLSAEDQVSLMARMEHENWCQGKMQEGWEYGQKKNSGIKHNPSLLPWDDLPAIEKEKNKKYIRDLPKLFAQAGFQIEKH